MISLNISFILTKELMIVGFRNYNQNPNPNQNQYSIFFEILIQKKDDLPKYDNLFVELSLYNRSDINNKTKSQIKCDLDKETYQTKDKNNILYRCKNDDNSIIFDGIKVNKNFKFNSTNETDATLVESDIDESFLSKETINDITTQNFSWDFEAFYLDNIDKENDEYILNGKIYGNFTEGYAFLNLSNNTFDCFVNTTVIKFTPNGTINDHLVGKLANLTDTDEKKILIFSTDYDNDLIQYPIEENSYVDLLDINNYSPPKDGKNATNRAYFRGTINNLKNYLRFTARLIFNTTSLRNLQENYKIVNATGQRVYYDLKSGLVIYDISYNDTANLTRKIVAIESLGDYRFSNTENSFPPSTLIIIIINKYLYFTNENSEIPEFITYISDKPNIDGNSFSFDLELPSSNQSLNISGKQPVHLNYYSLENSDYEEIDCTIENKTRLCTIMCEPRKDVYTQFKRLIVKIPKISSRRLRFLDSSGNSTFFAPTDAPGDIQFEYNPEINTFGRRSSKKKGLSGGAIAAIVLATIAAIAAVAVAIFFLNRGPVHPIKTSTEMNLPNSTTNINN
jgi:hypothetical protein